MPATVSNPKKTVEELFVKPAVLSTGHANRLVKHYFKLAEELFGVDMSGVIIQYNLKGKAAGTANWTNNRVTREVTNLRLRFNVEAIKLDWDDFVKDTIPHEVAHLVCILKPELGKNHDAGWVRVSQALGCSGKRTHSLKLTPARRTKRYVYTGRCGGTIEISSVRHGKIQRRGAVYRFKNGITVDKQCQYKLAA